MNIAPKDDPNLPSWESPEYKINSPILEFLDDMYCGKSEWHSGEEVIDQQKAERYLPREQEEPITAYKNRLARSRFDRRFRDAIDKDYSGILSVFTRNNLPLSLENNDDNVDLLGNSLEAFLKKLDQLALRDGVLGVLTDYTKPSILITTEADRIAANQRPYWVAIERENILSWRYENHQLSRLIIKEYLKIPQGKYGFDYKQVYRILYVGAYQLIELIKDSNCYVEKILEEGLTGLAYIPFTLYSLTDANYCADPPLQDLAELNLEYYQIHSEKREIMRKCNCPTLIVNALNQMSLDPLSEIDKFITVGPNTVLFNVDARWIEPTGTAIAMTQQEERQIDDAIGRKTLSFLTGEGNTRTATEVELGSAQSRANLIGLATLKESCVENMVYHWMGYESGGNLENIGVEAAGITIDKNLLKSPVRWTAREIQDAVTQGLISHRLGLIILKDKGYLPEGFTNNDLRLELALSNQSLDNDFLTPDLSNENQVLG